MSFPKYPAYKDSGVEWLGDTPEQWSIKPLWTLFKRNKITGFPDEQLLSVYRDYGVIPKASRDDNFNKPSDDLSSYQLVQVGDLAINKMKAWQGSVGISAHQGIVSPAYHIYSPNHSENPQYLHHLFRSNQYIAGYLANSKGIRVNQWDLEPQQHSRMPVLLPSLFEQTQIARFLDHETARIDALIEEQQRLIELLKEKRQALIFHTLTKGLDPSVPMKSSGVEWLGDVPAHWSVVPTNYRYEIQLGRMLNEQRSQGENLKPYLRVFDVQWHSINTTDLPTMDFPPDVQPMYRLKNGDLLVNEGGSYVGRSAIWRDDLDECYYQKALHRLRTHDPKKDTSEFFLYVMEMATQQGVFVAGGNQTTIDHLTAEQLRKYRFAFPPLKEQQQIAEFLSGESSKISSTTSEAEKLIGFLQERRSALISAAVTGKIDLRAWQPPASTTASIREQETA